MAYPLGRIGIVAYDTYSAGKTYQPLDLVPYEGGSYICKAQTAGNLPTNTLFWIKVASKGADAQNIELQLSATHIQWRVAGGTWANLIPLSAITGAKGETGATGHGLTVLGYYTTPTALQTAVPTPAPGDAYGVGAGEPYDIYIYGVPGGWVNNGPLQGAPGKDGKDGAYPVVDQVVTEGSGNPASSAAVIDYVAQYAPTPGGSDSTAQMGTAYPIRLDNTLGWIREQKIVFDPPFSAIPKVLVRVSPQALAGELSIPAYGEPFKALQATVAEVTESYCKVWLSNGSGTQLFAGFDWLAFEEDSFGQGPAGTLRVGTVATGEPGTDAMVTNIGTPSAAVLDFTIPRGEPGTKVEMGVNTTHIQWRYVGGSWADLVSLSALIGPTGATGPIGGIGPIGPDGKSIELQKTATHIQWRVAGGTWADLITLSELKGAVGEKGDLTTITIGTVTTGAPGTQAIITERGTPEARIWDVQIPAGQNGQDGKDGKDGTSAGDMTKAVYDANGDGAVDRADHAVNADHASDADKLGGKPASAYLLDKELAEWAKQPQKPSYTASDVGAATTAQGTKADNALPATSAAADSAKLGGQLPAYYAPAAELAAKQPQIKAGTAQLTATGWTAVTGGYQKTVSVTGIPADSAATVTDIKPAPDSLIEYVGCSVFCSAQAVGTLTFWAKKVPTNTLTVNIVLMAVTAL